MTDPFTYAIDADAIRPGRAVAVQIGNRWLVVCNDRGQFYAGDNLCPHAGGSLGKGDVHDGCVVCPVHHWPWDLATGLSDPNMPYLRLKRYPCEVRSGKIYIDITQSLP